MTLFLKPKQANCNTGSTLSTANTTQPASWRQWLRIHPAAELFPLSAEDVRALADDIKRHKLRAPVSVIKNEQGYVLLDGRSRLDAMELAGKKIDINDKGIFEHLSASIDVQAFVISKNIHRRHLTSEQKRDLIGKFLEANPEKSNLQIAREIKADDKTVASVRREKEARSEIPNVETRIDAKGRKQPANKMANNAAPKRHRPSANRAPQPLKLHTRTLIDRWDFATPEERAGLVKARWIDILRLHQKLEAAQNQLWTPEQPDNGLDIPAASLLRAPSGDRR